MENFQYHKNKGWNVIFTEQQLFITKGNDETYLVDDVDIETSREFFNLYKNNFKNLDLDNEKIYKLIKKMEVAGVIYKKRKIKENKIRIYLRYFEEKHKEIDKRIRDEVNLIDGIEIAESIKNSDLLILIRTNGRLVPILDKYTELKIPHLFIDLAYNHTISFGPMVFPGETACMGCFIGRITRNWGDATPPQESNVLKKLNIIVSLLVDHLKIFKDEGICPLLVNQAWSFNLQDFTSNFDKIFRLPWCPICFPSKTSEGAGSFELPWNIKDSQK